MKIASKLAMMAMTTAATMPPTIGPTTAGDDETVFVVETTLTFPAPWMLKQNIKCYNCLVSMLSLHSSTLIGFENSVLCYPLRVK